MFESGNSLFVRVLRISKLNFAFHPVYYCNTLIILSHMEVGRRGRKGRDRGREGGNGEGENGEREEGRE